MYTGIRLLLLIHPFISLVFFLSNFQRFKFIVALFSETVRPIKLTHDTHVDSGWMYHVYRNQAAASYLSLFYFVSNVQKFKIFVTLFSGTVRPKQFKLGTLVDNGWMYRVFQTQAAAACLSLYFFLSLQLSNIYNFCHIFLRNCEAWKFETWYTCGQWACIVYVGCSGSSWNLVIKCSNIYIILSFFEISQVDINELASRS